MRAHIDNYTEKELRDIISNSKNFNDVYSKNFYLWCS